MKRSISFILVGVGVFILIFGAVRFIGAQPAKVGGPCEYSDYKGKAAITSVEKTERSKEQAKTEGGPGYEGYEVWFNFQPSQDIKEEWALEPVGRPHLFQLYNSWYPGPEYIKKYRIKAGRVYNCTLKVITKGTCTPVIFEFENIKRNDYFETKR